jgi:hypothetical protein
VWTNISDNVSEMICDLYRASTEYNIVGLKRNCEQTLASQISIHSACDILIVSDECGGANLHNICLKYISMNTEAVMMTEGFRKLNANLCRKVLGEVSNAEKVQKQRSNTDHSVLSSMDESSSSNNFTPQEFQNRDDLRKKMNSGPHEMDNNDEKFKKTNNFNAQEDLHDGNDDNQNNNFAPLKFYDTEDSKINM